MAFRSSTFRACRAARRAARKGEQQGRNQMTAYNVVRMRVKPGREADYVQSHRSIDAAALRKAGMRKFSIVKTGDRTFCVIGEWDSFDSIVAGRPEMIGQLNRMRDMLEDLGDGKGVTDAVSGESVLEL
jgi:L-rhamnose mutarotase